MEYSVLMSVYQNENPQFLQSAIDSMLAQTVKTDDFVIVWDGPLTKELEGILEKYHRLFPQIFRYLKIDHNVGLGNALAQGLPYCRHSLIARMDSDDISVADRIERQLKQFEKVPQLTLCGGQIEEFITDPEHIESIRTVPCSYSEIYQYAKKRNPMNHMTVMFRKEAVLEAGNYIPMDLAEDYYLWVRMLMKGFEMENLSFVLVKARVGNGMFSRRGGRGYARSMRRLMVEFYQIGFLNLGELIKNIVIRTVVSVLPSDIRQAVYKKGLRR